MEIFLVVTVIAMIVIIIIDTGRKRRDFLCQREEYSRHSQAYH